MPAVVSGRASFELKHNNTPITVDYMFWLVNSAFWLSVIRKMTSNDSRQCRVYVAVGEKSGKQQIEGEVRDSIRSDFQVAIDYQAAGQSGGRQH